MFSSSSSTRYRLIRNALSHITIRGLKLVRAARGKGTLEEVKAASDQITHDNVVRALETLEESVSILTGKCHSIM